MDNILMLELFINDFSMLDDISKQNLINSIENIAVVTNDEKDIEKINYNIGMAFKAIPSPYYVI